jgi:hypothetical protein
MVKWSGPEMGERRQAAIFDIQRPRGRFQDQAAVLALLSMFDYCGVSFSWFFNLRSASRMSALKDAQY